MAKAKNRRGVFILGQFAVEQHGFASGKQQVCAADFLFWIFQGAGEDFRGLHRSDVGATHQQIGRGAERDDAFGDLCGALDAFLGEIAIGIGRRFWVFAVDGDAVSHDVELHELTPCSIFLSINAVLRSGVKRGVFDVVARASWDLAVLHPDHGVTRRPRLSRARLPEIKAHVELLFEKFGAAIGIAQVFGGVALRGYLKSDGATLE